jgi:hypothetical protein
MSKPGLGLPHRRWLEPALTFNLAPAAYLHDTWLDEMPHGGVVGLLRHDRNAVIRVSRHVLGCFGLLDQYWNDFSDARARIALLDAPALETLLLYLGLAVRSKEVRNELSGEGVRRLRRAFGESAFSFAVKRAPFLGRIPDFDYEPGEREPRARMILIGARLVLPPEAMRESRFAQRVAFKLPKPLASEILATQGNPAHSGHDGGQMPGIAKTLIREFLPEWRPLFD